MAVKREVMNTPIEAIGLPPADFEMQARKAIELVPDEWEGVYVGPQFRYEKTESGNDWPVEYIGAGWQFIKDGKYVGFMTEKPQDLLNDTVRADYLNEVRHSFSLVGIR